MWFCFIRNVINKIYMFWKRKKRLIPNTEPLVASQSAFFVFSKQSSSYTHPPPKNEQWVCPLEALLLETWKRCYNYFKLICALSLKKLCTMGLINLHHKIIIFFILKWREYCSFKVTMIYTFILKKKKWE